MYTILKSEPELQVSSTLVLLLFVILMVVIIIEAATNTFEKHFFVGTMLVMVLVLLLIASMFIKTEKTGYTLYTIHVDDEELSEILSKYKVEKYLGDDIFVITDNPGE